MKHMNDPELYEKINKVQRRDTKVILEQTKFKWRSNARVLDIGCGDGSVTVEILKRHLPESFVKLLGCDISHDSVEYAQARYGNIKIQFKVFDIQEDIPSELKGSFDHVFSFYVFHWLRRQEVAFTNVFDLLAEGGSCLIHFLGRTTLYEAYEKLSRMPKWSADLKDVHTKFISPYFDSQDPASEVRQMMEKIGFKNVDMQVLKKTYSFDAEEFRRLIKWINPFDGLNGKWDDFIADYNDLDREVGIETYSLIVAFGSK